MSYTSIMRGQLSQRDIGKYNCEYIPHDGTQQKVKDWILNCPNDTFSLSEVCQALNLKSAKVSSAIARLLSTNVIKSLGVGMYRRLPCKVALVG